VCGALRGHLRRATPLAIYEKTLAPDHPELGITLLALARLLMDQERDAEAEVLGLRALGIFEAKYGKVHRNVSATHVTLARVQRQLGRLDESQAHLDTAIATAITIYGPEHTIVAAMIDALAYVYLAKQDYPGALAEFRRSVAMYEKLDTTDPGMIEPLLGTGESLIALKRPADATAPLERALAWSLAMVATDVTYTPAYIATIRWPVAQALWAVGERPRALKEARAAREAWAAAVKGYGEELGAVMAWLAERDR